ncbi:MAG: hypothetical protein ACI4E1_15145, partial [Lachnospira sp.]
RLSEGIYGVVGSVRYVIGDTILLVNGSRNGSENEFGECRRLVSDGTMRLLFLTSLIKANHMIK